MTDDEHSRIDRALVIAAHPDDIDFSCAGTVALWTDAGVAVTYCLVTDGDAGGFDPAVPRSEIGGIRQAEQRAAAAVAGVHELVFLGYPDGRLTVTLELRRDLARVIREVRPDRVVVPSPVRDLDSMYGSHPDHTATGEAALCAVYPDARNPWAHPELAEAGFAAHTVGEVWVTGGPLGAPDSARHVDITDTFDRKIAALRAHESQTAHMTDLDGLIRDWAQSQAKQAGFQPGRFAESFRALDTR
ncbi:MULTISPECIES: PIG-L deacetylase family protein [Pseudonocardia]|uniref:Mycothiol S-conjugate amidase n=2 Tax=Pseudonocardia TaxID=1847 RepID=A0A1Y2N711_PSEAH|nr:MULTISPECIES: PIG-L deacetylase family protein [Pseudonocardia]OSY43256.1 Mycothiol S-conjugate amidase [Pseudonocardia autotrophica]TDN71744.1 LmbE family N-acetylglucosaminyl deacetylase [Pseudonocardia autotrophica]BBG02431.1 GlcNAc-PI de-N-acetylase [Pseudonocardia autotrophica]GEC23233.1 GlcNAc-PI de-N-acetylase [Pseudonocardia saturnea]